MQKSLGLVVLTVIAVSIFGSAIWLVESKPIFLSNETTCHREDSYSLCSFKQEIQRTGLFQVDAPSQKELCEACHYVMPLIRGLVDANDTSMFPKIATIICVLLKIEDENVCSQAIGLFDKVFLSVVRDSPLTDDELCSVGIGCAPITNPILNWNITLPNVPKPPVQPPVPPQPGSPTTRILQISDIHIDFEYTPGSLAQCGQPLCCRKSSTPKNKPMPKSGNQSIFAGYWGDYRSCDIPLWTVENMFDYISKNEKFDFVYWTGDLPPHNVWNQSRSDQLNALDVITNLFGKYFGDKVIYPTLGNHEATPVNLYPPPNIKEDNITWLYSALARDWTKTGLPSYLQANITRGAFYTLQIKKGLRLISLNTNYCQDRNYWLYINATDPLGQLKWLADTLQQSENINEKVHIIGHIRPSSCLDSWSDNYYRIINRYESTVSGQFFGHSHSDSFEMMYDLGNVKRAVSVIYVSGSVTTYSNLNPGYRIYTLDGDSNSKSTLTNSSWQVLDHQTFIANLTQANLGGSSTPPQWKQEYSAKDAYNLSNTFAQDWADLLDKMLNDLEGPLVDKLLIYYRKSADVEDPCDKTCRKNFLCDLKQARSRPFIPC